MERGLRVRTRSVTGVRPPLADDHLAQAFGHHASKPSSQNRHRPWQGPASREKLRERGERRARRRGTDRADKTFRAPLEISRRSRYEAQGRPFRLACPCVAARGRQGQRAGRAGPREPVLRSVNAALRA
jgi:hypothetical protein